MSSQRLPNELLDIILSYTRDDPATISACAQVCRDWAPVMQRILFQDLSITVYVRSKSRVPPFRETVRFMPDIRPLYKASKRSPRLLAYVRTFALKIHGDYWRYKALIDAPGRFIQSRIAKIWARYFPHILHGLVNLEKFLFTNYLMNPLMILMNHCPDTIRDGLIALLRLPSLRSLSMPFGSAFELFSMLRECPQITDLSLGMITCSSHFDVALYPRVPALNLDSLFVSCGKFLFLRLLNREFPSQDLIKFDQLNRLQIHVSMCYVMGDWSVIETTEEVLVQNKETLRHLSINLYLNEPLYKLVDLSRLQTVEFKIETCTSMAEDVSTPHRWLEWLNLSFTGVDVAVEECTLQLVQFSVPDDIESYIDEWRALDVILASWQYLKKFVVVNQWRGPSFSEPRLCGICAEDVESAFPRMSASGRLELTS